MRTEPARKGVVLAGGSGARLYPITHSISTRLPPPFDKPMTCDPLSALMLAGPREVAVITTPADQDRFRPLLGDGSRRGMSISYIARPKPEGLVRADVLAEELLDGAGSAMALGDDIFFGHGLPDMLQAAGKRAAGAPSSSRGFAWLDAGDFVRTIEERRNLKVGCPEEIAHFIGWIDADALREPAEPYLKTEYGKYLMRVADGG